jgi:hypothetical protein
VPDVADYVDLTISQARDQFRALPVRRPVQSGRQVTFLPVETLLVGPIRSSGVRQDHYADGSGRSAG